VTTLAQPAGCQFTLGFATLHSLIPAVVGGCLEDAHYAGDTGDGLQQTTNGLLVWRKSDNWTAFTDGNRSWVNGPLGLEQRDNSGRLWWEANPQHLSVVPAPTPGDRCHTSGLDLSLVGVDAGAGNLVGTFRFTNWQDVGCTMFGFPGAELRDAADNPLPTNPVRGGGYFTGDPSPSDVSVAPGGTAIFRIHWEQVPVGNETNCPMASGLAITPPDEFVPLHVTAQIRACGGGTLNISRVQPE
jgi:hypothetical protein